MRTVWIWTPKATRNLSRLILPTLGACIIAATAFAQSTVFFTNAGDIAFPFTPPKADGTPGTIKNMTISGAGTTITVDAIEAGDASLGITGLAAAQGGAIAMVGGASSTTGNAGGAITGVGGTPGATGVGGAVSLTGGAGGSTSGTGGAASLKGGAGTGGNAVGGAAAVTAGAGQGTGAGAVASLTGGASGGGATGNGGAVTATGGAAASTNGVGGAVTLTGGLGKGTQAGGAASLVGGAAGATGTGGAASVTGGAATAGVGGAVTLSAGASAGGTNNGADVNIVPSAAVSTGIPGTFKVNGDANLMCATFYTIGAPAAATDTVFYVATRPLYVVSVSEVHAVAAGGASVLQVTKDTSTNAPGAGTDLLTNNTNTGFDLNGTANTVQTGTLIATVATRTLAAGDRLAVDFANAIQASSGVAVTACMAPL